MFVLDIQPPKLIVVKKVNPISLSRVFLEVNFKSTLPSPCTAALDPLPIKMVLLSVA
jgi:hypothetical protein